MTGTFENLGFEVAGAAPGMAASWTLTWRASAEEVAGYDAPEAPAEDFEAGWADNEAFLFAFEASDVVPALYGSSPESVERFEAAWADNEAFLFALGSVEAASYGAVKLVEDFEAGFAGDEAFLFAFTGAELVGIGDDFEASWRGNEAFLFAFGDSDLGAGPIESFEAGFTTRMTTV